MHSFEEVDDFSHFTSTPLTHDFQQHVLPQPPSPPPPFPLLASCDHNLTTSITQKGPRKPHVYDLKDNDDRDDDDQKRKKLIHRNIERQRRQDLATLYCSLRSKLPLEWKKGKRTITDSTNVAISYIQHLQKLIADLNEKRDDLKRLCSSNSPDDRSECGVSHVKVEACGPDRLQVIVVGPKSGGLPLSKVLNLLMQEGLATVSCISSNVNQMTWIHTIESEDLDNYKTIVSLLTSTQYISPNPVSDERSIDIMNLQQKLQSSSTR